MKFKAYDGVECDTAEQAAEYTIAGKMIEAGKPPSYLDAGEAIEFIVANYADIHAELVKLLPLPGHRRAPVTEAQRRALRRLASYGEKGATCTTLSESPVTMNALHKKGKVTLERRDGQDYWIAV